METEEKVTVESQVKATDDFDFGIPATEQTKPVEQDKPKEQPTQAQYNAMWNWLNEKGIEIPEKVKTGKFEEGETEFDVIRDTILEHTELPGENDPFIKTYLEAEDKDAYLENYIQSRKFDNLPPDEGIRKALTMQQNDKGERLFTDEEIDEELNGLTKLQKKKMWEDIKIQRKNALSEQQKAIDEQRKAEYQANFGKIQQQRKAIVEQMLTAEDNIKDLQGIPYTDELRSRVKENFQKLNEINPKTGIPYFNEMLMDNEKYLQIVRAWTLFNDESIRHHLTNLKEDVKDDIIDKLGLKPRSQGGITKQRPAQTFDDFD